jgi:4-hydroxybutyryl-CoA synthetase (ADP-forming)
MLLNFLLSNENTNENLKNIFLSPSSIAVIGASEKPGVGKAIFSNILNGYTGKIYPIIEFLKT